VILEAMASGLPVVATTVGGIPFEVSEETGLLVAPGDATALALAVDRLCADPVTRRAMGAAARSRVAALFDWDASADKAVAIYEEVVARKRAER
jgi:glycosyltransferase involved in cell wall biosynthesis